MKFNYNGKIYTISADAGAIHDEVKKQKIDIVKDYDMATCDTMIQFRPTFKFVAEFKKLKTIDHETIVSLHSNGLLEIYMDKVVKLMFDTPTEDIPELLSFDVSITEMLTKYVVSLATKGWKFDCLEVRLDFTMTNDEELLLAADNLIDVTNIDANDNTDVSRVDLFSQTLTKLEAGGPCGVTNEILQKLTILQELSVDNNEIITTVTPIGGTLTSLYAGGDCALNDEGLEGAYMLEELDCTDNDDITSAKPFATTIRILHTGGGFRDEGLEEVTGLKELTITDNLEITKFDSFAKSLERLFLFGDSKIDDISMAKVHKLQELYAFDVEGITTVDPFANTLTELDAGGKCGIDDEGLKNAKKLTKLEARGNPNIDVSMHLTRASITTGHAS